MFASILDFGLFWVTSQSANISECMYVEKNCHMVFLELLEDQHHHQMRNDFYAKN